MELKRESKSPELVVKCTVCGKRMDAGDVGDQCTCSPISTGASAVTAEVGLAETSNSNADDCSNTCAVGSTTVASHSSIREQPLSEEEREAVSKNLGARYRVVSLLGRGGMGSVYKVLDTEIGKHFAIKVLNSQLVTDSSSIKRFEQEAKAARDLTQANLVAVYDYGVGASGLPFIIMDYLDGDTLSDILKKEGFLDVSRALDIFIQVCEAVVHAHMKGVIHRDIKPSNIIVEKGADSIDLAKLVDFGIAKVMPRQEQLNQMTQTGEIFGSPVYMSPEQCLGNKLDARSDIYELGCVMYEALTGIQPFAAENPVKSILKHISEDVIPISNLKHDFAVPKELERIVLHCLEREPSGRYQTAQALLTDLQAVRDGRKISIEPRATKKKAKPSVVKMLVAGSGMLIFVGLVGGYFQFAHFFTPLNPESDSERLDQLSFQYFNQGQYAKAIPLLEFGVEHYKESGKHESFLADQLQHIGKCYLKMNQPEKAVAPYKEALSHYVKWGNYPGGGMPEAVNDYAEVLKKLGKGDVAESMKSEFAKTGNIRIVP